jgi:hypothetical protein
MALEVASSDPPDVSSRQTAINQSEQASERPTALLSARSGKVSLALHRGVDDRN